MPSRSTPEYADAHKRLGSLLEDMGNLEGAIEAMQGYIDAGDPDGDGDEALARLKAPRADAMDDNDSVASDEKNRQELEDKAADKPWVTHPVPSVELVGPTVPGLVWRSP